MSIRIASNNPAVSEEPVRQNTGTGFQAGENLTAGHWNWSMLEIQKAFDNLREYALGEIVKFDAPLPESYAQEKKLIRLADHTQLSKADFPELYDEIKKQHENGDIANLSSKQNVYDATHCTATHVIFPKPFNINDYPRQGRLVTLPQVPADSQNVSFVYNHHKDKIAFVSFDGNQPNNLGLYEFDERNVSGVSRIASVNRTNITGFNGNGYLRSLYYNATDYFINHSVSTDSLYRSTRIQNGTTFLTTPQNIRVNNGKTVGTSPADYTISFSNLFFSYLYRGVPLLAVHKNSKFYLVSIDGFGANYEFLIEPPDSTTSQKIIQLDEKTILSVSTNSSYAREEFIIDLAENYVLEKLPYSRIASHSNYGTSSGALAHYDKKTKTYIAFSYDNVDDVYVYSPFGIVKAKSIPYGSRFKLVRNDIAYAITDGTDGGTTGGMIPYSLSTETYENAYIQT